MRPRFAGFVGAHQNQRGRAVVETRGVAGGHRALLVEGRLQLGHRVQRRTGANILVLIDDDVALSGLDGDGNDLVLEPAGLLRILGLVLRAGGERVLLFAGDLPFGGDVLRGDSHVIAVERVQQAVLQHGVDELDVAHLGAVRAYARHAATSTSTPCRRRR